MTKKNYKLIDIFYIFIFILPILDLISSLTRRLTDFELSLGMLIKGLMLVIGAIYVLFKSKSKFKKASIIYFGFCFLYTVAYFLFKLDLLTLTHLKVELNYLVKFFYFPAMFFILLNLFDDQGFDRTKLDKIMLISIAVYTLLVIIPTVLGINFNSYINDYAGSVGWFYSANEVSTILLLLFPFVYKLLKTNRLVLAIIFASTLYMISLIGTKVTMFGIIIISFLLFLSAFFYKKKKNYRNVLITGLMFAVVVAIMCTNYSAMNLKSALSSEQQKEIADLTEKIEDEVKDNEVIQFMRRYFAPLLSHRDVYAINTYKIFQDNYKSGYMLFGMGFSRTDRIDEYYVEKLIEMDPLDTFFHLGGIAVILWITPFFYTLYMFIKLKGKLSVELFFFTMTILLTVGIATFAGHVYIAPAVSIYVVLYFSYLLDSFYRFKSPHQSTKKEDKITFFNLHLGIGGIETATIETANALIDKYRVEIVVFYKVKDDRSYLLNPKISVRHLYDGEPNREAFLSYLRSFRLFKTFKEGLLSTKILFLKRFLMIEAIKNSKSKVLVSTSIQIGKLLSKYKPQGAIAIAEEHHHHNDNKRYIWTLQHEYGNIDYLFALTSTLARDYEKFLKGHNDYTEVVHMPNLHDYKKYREKSSLSEPNLISIGRLVPGKKIDEMISLFSQIENKKAKLFIVGDGTEKPKLEALAKSLNLENRIVFTGSLTVEEQKKYYLQSSLFLMTSLTEGLPMVILEANSYGLPCIAFETASGVGDIIENGKNGYIIEDRDAEKFVERIDELLKDEKKIKSFSKNTITSLKKYDKPTVMAKWERVLATHLNSTHQK